MTRISVLTPVWNEQAYFDEMVESLISQTHSDWELLVIDDGSTDDSAAVIEKWAAKEPRVVPVSLRVKMGKVEAFNRAFTASTGELICLCGGDDTMPSDSLERRVAALQPYLEMRAAAFFKLKTFSEERKFDGAILPRGKSGSRSGGSMTLTRSLAQEAFPIAPGLPSEDTWLSQAIAALAEKIVDDPSIVLNYRIHAGNSNPRHRDFASMNESLHSRMRAIDLILSQDRFEVPREQRRRLEIQSAAEDLRYRGRTLEILGMSDLGLIDRLAVAQASDPRLRWLRDRVYLLTSGWRGQ